MSALCPLGGPIHSKIIIEALNGMSGKEATFFFDMQDYKRTWLVLKDMESDYMDTKSSITTQSRLITTGLNFFKER